VTPWINVRHRIDGDVAVVTVEGEIDISNVGDVQAEILQHVPSHVLGLALDLSTMEYMDSQGVRMLLDFADGLRARRQRFAIVVAGTSLVHRIIELTQIHTAVPVETDMAAALSSLRSPRAP